MRLIVDRIESDIAVCEMENGQMEDIRLSDLPFIPREGDVLIREGTNIRFSHEETRKRKVEAEKISEGLWD